MYESAPVIIVGAGPVGLSLALGLAHYGVRSIVLEEKTELNEYSRALLIATRTLEIFRAWGVLDRFLQETPLITEREVWLVGRQKPQAKIDFSSLARHSGIHGVMVLPQNRTEAVLLEVVQATGMAEVRFGVQVTDFQQGNDGVTVACDGPQGAEQVHGAYLAGCDGAHSVVREKLGWHLQGKTYPTRLMLADICLADARDELPWPRLAPLPDSLLAGIRFASGEWRIIATLPEGESDEAAQSPDGLKRKVEALFGPGPFECKWSSGFRIHCRTSPHFRKGRVVLAGDAAHINSPAGGQGMNAGIQDAHNLAWKMAAALQGSNADTLLASYETERRGAVTRNVERITDLLTRLFLMPPPPVRAFFGRIMALALKISPVRRRMALTAGMLLTNYGSSALLRDGEFVGRRACDGDVRDNNGKVQRLLDLVNDQAVLLLFDEGHPPGWNVAEIRTLLSDIPDLWVVLLKPNTTNTPDTQDENTFIDVSGNLWLDWDAESDLAALIRPDGYVGYTARKPPPGELKAGVKRALGLNLT